MTEPTKEQIAWYILDEIVVKHSAIHGGGKCSICDRCIEAMKLLVKPTSEQCQTLYEQRKGL